MIERLLEPLRKDTIDFFFPDILLTYLGSFRQLFSSPQAGLAAAFDFYIDSVSERRYTTFITRFIAAFNGF